MPSLDRIAFGALIVVWIAALATLALAQPMPMPQCPGFASLTAELARGYGEVPAGQGLRGDSGAPPEGALVALYANPETGTWTLVQVAPDGTACITAAGEAWEPAEPPLPGEPS